MVGKKAHQLLLTMALFGLFAKSFQDCPKIYGGFPDHSACVEKSSNAVKSGLSEGDKEKILKLHNEYRQSTKPPACNMLKMYWDDDLAYVAQKWTDNCDFSHDKGHNRRIPGKFSVGQNLAQGQTSWDEVLTMWHNEVKDFKYGDNSQNVMSVGHYTQIVWATTPRVGCGYTKCSNLRSFYACNYGPAGNLMGQIGKPYESCSTGAQMSDCKTSICYNGGVMDKDSCKCTCLEKPYIIGQNCALNCSIAKDSGPMCDETPAEDCVEYSNIPDECPWKCGICPYADYRKGTKESATSAPSGNESDNAQAGKKPAESVPKENGSIVISATLYMCMLLPLNIYIFF